MNIRRIGSFGMIDTGTQLLSYQAVGRGTGWEPSSIVFAPGARYQRMQWGDKVIVPFGINNDLPGEVKRLLARFYAGEGIMGKIVGLQWGVGPRFYREAVDEASNQYYRQWLVDKKMRDELEKFDFEQFMLRCMVDYNHLNGFFVKIVRTRGSRVGGVGRIHHLEHIPIANVRLVYPPEGEDVCKSVIVGDWPYPDKRYTYEYPMFDPNDPFKHPVSVAYYRNYTFGDKFYSLPRFAGAMKWLELAGGLADILINYNMNASAISLHIESPQSYWDAAEERIREICRQTGEQYTSRMLEEFKDDAMAQFASQVTGSKNAGKYIHTNRFWNAEANAFEGWTVKEVDKKIKDYVDAQVKISNKADAAATSGFGLDPILSNLIIENKLSSGSEKLYSLKVYNASETAIPDMVVCKPIQTFMEINHPGTDLRIGFYRSSVETEQNISPQNRMKNNDE